MRRHGILSHTLLLGAATSALCAVAAPAAAQTAAGASAAPSDGTEDIVVTARRREESLQNVPIAVTAFTGESLEKRGVTDIGQLQDVTPNTTFHPSRGTNSTLTAFIRGVGQQDPVAGFEAGVGLYLDDVYLNRPQASLLDIYDVERIEVLRGPQGTLYGRNTIGGAIKYVTKRLSDDPSLSARANLGSYKQADLIVSASTPVTDGIKIGAAGARLSRGGFGDNINNGLENYNRDIWAARGTIELEPSSTFFARITGDYTKDNSDPRNGHRLIPALSGGFPVLSNVYDTQAGLNSPRQSVEAYGVSGRAEWKATDNLTIKDIIAYRKDRSFAPIDFDSLPVADVDVPAIYRNHQFSNEFQLVYEGEKLQGVAGVYYLNANAFDVFDVVLATTSPAVLPGLTASTYGNVDTKTWAGFADFTYNFTDQIALSVGGRYTNDKREATVIRANYLNGPSPALGGTGTQLGALTSNFTGQKTFKQFTPRASLSYKPNEENTLYASYAKGFKGGGFDPRGLSTAAPDTNGDGVRSAAEIFDYFLFDPEKVNSYEVGYKASMFDKRLRFAVDGFYADYTNVQVPGSVGAVVNGIPTFVGVTTNAGKATFKGIEAEGSATLARDLGLADSRLNLSASLGYLDAKFDHYVTNIAGTGPVDVANFRRVQNTPKWTTSGTLSYAVAAGSGEVTADTTVSYRSLTHQFELPSPFLDQPGYTLWDANLVWTSKGDRYTIGLHAKNITNKHYITSGYQFLATDAVTGVPTRNAAGNYVSTLGTSGVVTAFYGNPRQVFASFGVKF